MDPILVRFIKGLSAFVNSPGHYAAAVTVLLWVLSDRVLGVFGYKTVRMDFGFCLFMIVSYWLIGTMLHIAQIENE